MSDVVSSVTTSTPSLGFGGTIVEALLSGFKYAWNFFLTKGIILAVLLFFVDLFMTLFFKLLESVLKMSDLGEMISEIEFPEPLKYLLYLGAIDYGLPLMIGAYVLKFFIRRLPVVG